MQSDSRSMLKMCTVTFFRCIFLTACMKGILESHRTEPGFCHHLNQHLNFPRILEPQIDFKSWSISWHNVNRPDFDVWLMLNYKYHWKKKMVKTNFGLKKFGLKFYLCQCPTWIWYQQLTSQKLLFLTYGWWSVNVNCWHH